MSRHRREYERRVNRVIDHIEKNPAADLSLEQLARIARFSPYHFHRIFKAATGETVLGFSQRLRVEKGARALLASADKSVLDAAQGCGFASGATFARAFRAHFGMSATEWRAGGHRHWRERKDRNTGNAFSKAGKASEPGDRHAGRLVPDDEMNIRVRKLPRYRVAYMRYVGPYGPKGISQLWAKLGKWRTAHGLDATSEILLGIAYDDPRIAATHTCRYDACVTVPREFRPTTHVNVMDTTSGRYAICQFNGTADNIVSVWESTFSRWLPDSGFEPDDAPCIEVYGSIGPDPTRPFHCELCLPVRAL